MPHLRAALPLLLIGLAACTDTTVKVYNTAPTVSITSPEDGSIYQPGTLVEVYGLARDSQQDPSTLLVSLSSSLDGELGSLTPDSEGITYAALSTLSAGLHALTLTAFDDAGESGQATVSVEMSYGGEVVGAPEVILIGPSEGQAYSGDEVVTVVATATDDEQAWDTLVASVVSSRDGLIWTGNPATSGAISADLPVMTEGVHALTLTIEDSDGNIDQATVSVEILPDGRPTVEILSPTSGTKTLTTATTLLEGVVVDDVSDPDAMTCTWASDLMGVLASGSPDSSGYCGAGISFTEGTHVITLLAIDEEGNEGSATVNLVVVDPRNTDDDFDGQTENGGDCDDADATVYSGATEVCDAKDNDCDSQVNESFYDTYDAGASPNNSLTAAYSLGEFSSGALWKSGKVTLSGLTFHTSTDEDWFWFEAEDEWYANLSLSVAVSGVPSGASYTVELYATSSSRGSPTLKDSASGTGVLKAEFEGASFSGDEDYWAVRVYPSSWTASACSGTYSIDLSASQDLL
ncbi:putative metal-binding motif-containing protein [Myxococcota bacterium]|nr:putative metal-binding motif-containing protein [Myxococcota bacterium]